MTRVLHSVESPGVLCPRWFGQLLEVTPDNLEVSAENDKTSSPIFEMLEGIVRVLSARLDDEKDYGPIDMAAILAIAEELGRAGLRSALRPAGRGAWDPNDRLSGVQLVAISQLGKLGDWKLCEDAIHATGIAEWTYPAIMSYAAKYADPAGLRPRGGGVMAAQGVRQRHGRGCTAQGRCKCPYEASVYSRRDGRKIRRQFPTAAAAKAWRDDAQGAVRRHQLRAPAPTTIAEAGKEGLTAPGRA